LSNKRTAVPARNEYYLIIFLSALLIRTYYIFRIQDSPFFYSPIIDDQEYLERAVYLLNNGFVWGNAYIHGPLLPYVYAFLMKFFNAGIFALRYAGCLLSSITAVLIAISAAKAFGRTTGKIAGFIYAFYWPAIYWSVSLVSETTALFFILAAIVCLQNASLNGLMSRYILSGIFLGISAMARPNSLLFLPFILLWGVLRRKDKQIVKGSVILIVSSMVIASAPVALNYFSQKDFTGMQTQSSLNLYLGVNPDIDSFSVRPGIKWEKLILAPMRTGVMTNLEFEKYYFIETLNVIAKNPVGFLKHLGDKILLIFSSTELSSGEYIYFNAAYAKWIYYLPGFLVIASLGAAGAVFAYKKEKGSDLLYIFLAGILIPSVFFQTCSRYRLSLAAILIIFSAYTIFSVISDIKKKDHRRPALMISTVLCVFIFIASDPAHSKNRDHSRPELQMAWAYLAKGNLSDAERCAAKAAVIWPEDADVYKTIGDVAFFLGDKKKAGKAYRKALRIEPDHYQCYNMLGQIELSSGKKEEAEKYFKMGTIINRENEYGKRKLKECGEL